MNLRKETGMIFYEGANWQIHRRQERRSQQNSWDWKNHINGVKEWVKQELSCIFDFK